jgi:hypothetical protein
VVECVVCVDVGELQYHSTTQRSVRRNWNCQNRLVKGYGRIKMGIVQSIEREAEVNIYVWEKGQCISGSGKWPLYER